MSQNPLPRRLSEQDLAQLYVQTQAPLQLDALLQGHTNGDDAMIAVHDSISEQAPDLALISLSLCGLVCARDYPEELKDGPCGPVIRELLVGAEDNLLSVGRLWLDSANDIEPDAKHDREIVLSIPDRLRILSSIFMELHEALEENFGAEPITQAMKTLFYQAESHADLAERFVEQLKKSARPTKATQKKKPLNQIPLPFELERPKQGAEIVPFTLFSSKKTH